MNEMQNPLASTPAEEGRDQEAATTRPSGPNDGRNSAEPEIIQGDHFWNPSDLMDENSQLSLHFNISEDSMAEIRSLISSTLEEPSNISLDLAVRGQTDGGGLSSPTLAGSSRLNPIQTQQANPQSSFSAINDDFLFDPNPFPPASQLVQHAQLETLTPRTEATTTLSTYGDRTSWSAQPVGKGQSHFTNTYHFNSSIGSTSRGVTSTSPPPSSSVHPVGMRPEVPMFCGLHYPSLSGHSYPHGMLPGGPMFHGVQSQPGYHHHQGMLREAPTFRGLHYPALSGEVIRPVARRIMTQPRRRARRGQPLRASRQTVAVRHSAPDPGPIFIPSTIEPSGYVCPVCDRDLAFPAEGQVNQPGLQPTVSILSCDHSFHDDCLREISPDGYPNEPPCPVCALRKSHFDRTKQW